MREKKEKRRVQTPNLPSSIKYTFEMPQYNAFEGG